MQALSTATNWINVALALGICLACSSIGGQMSRGTRCAVRLGVFAMFVGALLLVAGGIWEFGDWVQVVFSAGVLVYLVANLRAPAATPSSAWSNRLAWGVTFVVLAVLGFTFSIGS